MRDIGPLYQRNPAEEVTISEITHTTAAEAGRLLDSQILRPDDEAVAIVRLQGAFAVEGPSTPWSEPATTYYATQIFVFSDITGNLLRITWDDEQGSDVRS